MTNVLSKNQINKTFIFNSSKDKEMTTTSKLTFIGKTPNDYKVVHVTETYPAAATRHGYVMLVIIDKKGRQFNYMDVEMPAKMKNGVLYFKHKGKDGKFYYFRQDLTKELPKFLCVDKDDCFTYTSE
jgi:hypothetical protein